ncbi:N-methyl-L-tryptophan oxidase [Paenibacillus validus]|uniref:N-methyl-L-tryptophan oxidase n=1 Tax=Paenibacillus validus TaxID=44253 RepID=UPI003D2666C7
MHADYDVIVAGAGSFGMSAGYYAAKAGARVLMIDSGDPPHTLGSHHGGTRIFRAAYTMGAAYVRLALRANALWHELEQDYASLRTEQDFSSGPLFECTGVVSIGPISSRFIRSKLESCIEFGIAHRRLTAAEAREEWPGLFVPDSMEALYEPNAGVLHSERILRVYRELALRHGARLLPYTEALSIEATPDGYVIRTTGGDYYAKRVLASGGAWIGRLLPQLEAVTPIRKAVGWFEAPREQYGSGQLPAFIINNGGDEEYFGFPDLDGGGLKIGRHDGGVTAVYGNPLPAFGAYAEDESELRYALNRFLPDVRRLRSGQVCLYERSPGERFLIGEVPGRSGLWFAGGGSGHGFKFASAIGEALGTTLASGKTSPELDWQAFSLHS